MSGVAITRRGLVQMAGAALGAGTLPARSIAEHPDPDAALFKQIARHRSIREAHAAYEDVVEAADARFKAAAPARPAALAPMFRDGLWNFEATGREYRADGRIHGFCTMENVERIRAVNPVMTETWDENSEVVSSDSSPAGEARRQEIIEASDAWWRDRGAVAEFVGLTAANAEDERLYEAMWAARDAILETAPITLAGLRAKAAWAIGLNDAEEEVEAIVRQVAAFGGAVS